MNRLGRKRRWHDEIDDYNDDDDDEEEDDNDDGEWKYKTNNRTDFLSEINNVADEHVNPQRSILKSLTNY